MRKLLKRPEAPPPPTNVVTIPHDAANEAAVLVSAMSSEQVLDRILRKVKRDHFFVREHQELWDALSEVRRRRLELDDSALVTIGGEAVARYAVSLREGVPVPANIDFHVSAMLWDSARVQVAKGPLAGFVEAVRDPRAEPDKVRSLAKQISDGFEGYEDRQHLREPASLAREQMLEIERRMREQNIYSFGLSGLDYDIDYTGRKTLRMVPGTEPGKCSVLTAITGGGKSTVALNMALGIAFPEGDYSGQTPGRKVGYGAFEMGCGISLEVMALISLGWERNKFRPDPNRQAPTRDEFIRLEERMNVLGQRIQFLENPVVRKILKDEKGNDRRQNDRNLDMLEGCISDMGCDVFFADLWGKLIREGRPEDEKDALERQRRMAEDLRVHCVLLQQQRFKDVEKRADPRPTREGILGSGGWVEIADNLLGVHRPALAKRIQDDKLEVLVLKQRYGTYPLAVEFDWDPVKGHVWGGRSIEYDRPGEASEADAFFFGGGKGKKKG